MGTFPSASDVARPAPIPAEGIPSIAAPQYTTTSAETTIAAGRDAQQTAQDIDKFGLHIDTLLAQDAVNKLRADKADLTYGQQNGFMNVKGAAVLEPGPGGQKVFESYPARLQAAADAIGGKLGGRAAMMFKAKAEEEMGSYKTELLRHTMQQVDVAHKASYAAGSAQDVTEAVRFSFDQPALMKLEERARVRAQVEEQRGGLPEGSLSKPAVSNIFRAAMEDLVAKNDLTGALQMYGTFSSKLDGQDALAVQRQVKTVEKLLEVQGDISRYWGGAAGGVVGGGAATGGKVDHNIGNIVATNINYPGKGAPAGKFETFATPEHGVAAAYGTIQAKARQNGGTINFLDLMGGNTQRGGKVEGWSARPRNAAEAANPLLKGNDPEAYAARLARSVGLSPSDPVPLGDDEKMAKLLREMNAVEKGKITVPEEAFARGIRFAKGDTSIIPAKSDGAPTQSGGTVSRETLGPGAVAAPPAASSDPPFGPDNAPAPAAAPPGDPLAAAVNAVPGGSSPPRQEPGAPPPQEPGGGVLGIARAKIALNDQYNKARDAAMLERRLDLNLPAILSGLKVQYESQKLTLETEQLKVTNEMQMYVLQGGPNGSPATVPPNAALWSQFTAREQESYLKLFEHNATGRKTKTDQEAWYKIHAGLTNENANVRDQWAAEPLYKYKPFLSDQDFQELAKLQASVRKGDDKETRSRQAATRQVNDTLLRMGVDLTPKPGSAQIGEDTDAWKIARFHRLFEDERELLEKKTGQPASRHEIINIIDGMVKNVAADGWWTKERPVVFLRYKDIPEKERDAIVASIYKKGGSPTEERVLQVYQHDLVNKPTQTIIPRMGPRDSVRAGINTPELGLPGAGRSAPAPVSADENGDYVPPANPMHTLPVLDPYDYLKRMHPATLAAPDEEEKKPASTRATGPDWRGPPGKGERPTRRRSGLE